MKLLPIISNINYTKETPQQNTPVAFRARPKLKTDVFEKVSAEISEHIKTNLSSGGLGDKIKEQLNNKQQRNLFFSVVASLVTATAAQITELISTETKETAKPLKTPNSAKKERKKSEENCNKEEPAIQFTRHKGRQAEFEAELSGKIEALLAKPGFNDEDKAKMTALYNKFCGNNYKGCHYSPQRELTPNKTIVESYLKELSQCRDENEIKKLTDKYYNSFSIEEPPKTEDEIAKGILDNVEPNSANILKSYKNIQKTYIDAVKDEQDGSKAALFKEFTEKVEQTTDNDKFKKILYSRINRYYPDCLFEIINIYNQYSRSDSTQAASFLTLLSNKMANNEALKKWETSGCTQRLNFSTYNQLIINNLDDESIKAIAKLKRDTRLEDFDIIDQQKFIAKFPYLSFSRNFNLMNNIFELINKSSGYQPLKSEELMNFDTKDIEEEIQNHYYSYPNLKKHLEVKDKTYLSMGKMQNLIDMYYGNERNQNIFTLHSYLRFIERIVLPEIKENGEDEDIHSTKIIRQEFIKKLGELKSALNKAFKLPIEISTYQVENIKAPQLTMTLGDNESQSYTITINRNDKIHTIF